MNRPLWLALGIGAGLLLVALLGALLFYLLRPKPPPRLTLVPAPYESLAGWREDAVAAAVPALLRSCAAFLKKPDDVSLDPRPKSADFGSVAEWREACTAAAALGSGDDAAARRFFETRFTPLLAGNNGAPEGLFTGYFEIALNGSRRRFGPYRIPLYRRPPEPERYTRAEIEDGALAGQGLELLWVDDPIDAFFLEIQGSGRVRLRDGQIVFSERPGLGIERNREALHAYRID